MSIKKRKNNSFIIIDNEDENDIKILIDEETGINYLFYGESGNCCGGLTVRLNKNGKPYITKNIKNLTNTIKVKYINSEDEDKEE